MARPKARRNVGGWSATSRRIALLADAISSAVEVTPDTTLIETDESAEAEWRDVSRLPQPELWLVELEIVGRGTAVTLE